MWAWLLSLIAAAASGYAVYDSSYPRMENLFGPVDCTALTGNGELTAGVNSRGRLTVFRWPGPGGQNQLTYRTTPDGSEHAPPHHGAVWGLRTNGQTLWTHEAGWTTAQTEAVNGAPAVVTRLTHEETGVRVALTHLVDGARNVLATQIVAEGVSDDAEFYWYANFAPSTRSVPEIPLGDWAWDDLNDFAAFVDSDGRTLVQFRPRDPGSADWRAAEQLVYSDASPAEWQDFSSGTWIASQPAEPVRAYACGYGGEHLSLWHRVARGEFDNTPAMFGACATALAIEPERIGNQARATMFIGVAGNYDDAVELVAGARERRFAGLIKDAEDAWRIWTNIVALPDGQDANARSLALNHLRTLYLCQDKQTHCIVRAPYAQPPLALDWPRDGIWQTLALDLAGLHAEAENHTLFYADAVRREDQPGKPLGTLPAALYGNGTDALPHFVLDTEAVGWVLWSFWQHALSIPPDDRSAYLARIWDATDLSASFLAGWADPQEGVPLYSYDETVLREQRNFGFFVAVYIGMQAALRIADERGEARPDWRDHVMELENLIRYTSFDAQGQWKHDDGYLLAVSGLLEPSDPRWDDALKRAFDPAHYPLTAQQVLTRAVCFAWLWQGNPERLVQISYEMPDNIHGLLANRPPDALHSALAYLCIRLGYDPNLPSH